LNMQSSKAIDRIAISLPEARLEHDLWQRELAALSGVSASSICKLERGGRVDLECPRFRGHLSAGSVLSDLAGRMRHHAKGIELPEAVSAGVSA
jgi:DNA-binding XRE family transcriptional regulator